MTRERFEELAAAYGGDIARWPAPWREEAALLVASAPAFAHAVLARESALDGLLDEQARAPAPAALIERIVTSAPQRRARRTWSLWLAPAGLGAALTAVAVCGVMLGAQFGAHAAGDTASQTYAELDVSAVSEVG